LLFTISGRSRLCKDELHSAEMFANNAGIPIPPMEAEIESLTIGCGKKFNRSQFGE
jgi:hypothetical protein